MDPTHRMLLEATYEGFENGARQNSHALDLMLTTRQLA